MANPPTQGSNVGDLSNALVIAIQQATTNSPSTTSSAVPQMSVSQCYSSTNQSTSRGVEGEIRTTIIHIGLQLATSNMSYFTFYPDWCFG